MFKKIKLAAALVFVLLAVALGAYLYINISAESSLSAALPAPDNNRPYVLAEFSSDDFPVKITGLLYGTKYGAVKANTPEALLLSFIKEAKSTALLAELSDEKGLRLYVSMFFSPEELRSLKKGDIPPSWKDLPPVTISRGETKGCWVITENQTANTIYYAFSSDRVLAARTPGELSVMVSVREKNLDSAGSHSWKKNSSASNNAEISDGGMLLASADKLRPVKLRFSWDKLSGAVGTPAGRLDWELAVNRLPGILSGLKPVVWEKDELLAAEPSMATMGLNIPVLPQNYDKWPLPFKPAGAFARSLELSPKQASRAISGKSVFTVGGENSILWLTLPGFLMQFTGEEEDMRALVSAFWEKLFFGAEPVPVKGFTYGGKATLPFSTIGAGNGQMSVFGLISEASLRQSTLELPFLENNEAVVGWLTADMKNVSSALLKLAPAENYSATKDAPSIFDNEVPSEEDFYSEEPFQPEMSLTPFDRFLTRDFCEKLAALGKIVFVWEKPLSGRLLWY